MCGIIGVVRRRATRVPPEIAPLVADLDGAIARLDRWGGDVGELDAAASAIERVDGALHGVPGVRGLLADRAGALAVEHRAERVAELLALVESALDRVAIRRVGADLESVNAALLRAK